MSLSKFTYLCTEKGVFYVSYQLSLNFLNFSKKNKGFPGDSDGKKFLPARKETQVQSLDQEDSLEKETATTLVF